MLNILVRGITRADYSFFNFIKRYIPCDILINRLCGLKIKKTSKKLDVGCGNGHWLDIMSYLGYENLYGVDLFVPEERMSKKKIKHI